MLIWPSRAGELYRRTIARLQALWGLPDRLLHCGISVASAARFMAEMGHKPAYMSPRRADGMSVMPAIVSDFAALQRRKCSATSGLYIGKKALAAGGTCW
jgi:hypothetical protein